ncbi:MAG: DUF4372 domain-containing protein [Muribaculaceae bacterium]|nr:DUF4372 domain-containing protein [Muribaculaceae bacterium]
MIWAQLTSRQSLRDIESSLRVHSDKTFRMGIGKSISRNNIAHASANRDVAVFRELASEMMSRACHIAVKDDILTKIAEVFGTSGFLRLIQRPSRWDWTNICGQSLKRAGAESSCTPCTISSGRSRECVLSPFTRNATILHLQVKLIFREVI